MLHLEIYVTEQKQIQPFELAICLDCPEDKLLERYLRRARALPGQAPDDEARFERRLAEFQKENPTILNYFRDSDRVLIVSGHYKKVPNSPSSDRFQWQGG